MHDHRIKQTALLFSFYNNFVKDEFQLQERLNKLNVSHTSLCGNTAINLLNNTKTITRYSVLNTVQHRSCNILLTSISADSTRFSTISMHCLFTGGSSLITVSSAMSVAGTVNTENIFVHVNTFTLNNICTYKTHLSNFTNSKKCRYFCLWKHL